MEVTGETQPKTVYEPRQIAHTKRGVHLPQLELNADIDVVPDEKSERVGVVNEVARLGRPPALRGLDDNYVARRAVECLVAHLSKLYSSDV